MQLKEGEFSFEDLVKEFNQEEIIDENSPIDKLEEVKTEEEEELKVEEQEEEEKPLEELEKEKQSLEPKSPSKYLELAKAFLQKGKWQEVLIEVEEGKEVPLSELEDLDEEMFFQIQESQESLGKEDIETNYLSIKDLDERRKKVLSIVAKGGDLKEIFKDEATLEYYQNPFKNIDLDDEKTQETVYYNYLVKTRGNDPEVAELAIKKAKEDLTLDEKARKIVEANNKAFDKYVEDQEKKLEEKQKVEKEQEKAYRTNLLKVFKDIEVKDTVARRYADLATKKNTEGEYAIDALYNEQMQDPEKAAELIAFLDNKEEYLKKYIGKVKTEVSKENLKKIKVIKTKTENKRPNDTKEDPLELDEPIIGWNK